MFLSFWFQLFPCPGHIPVFGFHRHHIIPYNNPLLSLNEFELGLSVTCNHISPNTEVPA